MKMEFVKYVKRTKKEGNQKKNVKNIQKIMVKQLHTFMILKKVVGDVMLIRKIKKKIN